MNAKCRGFDVIKPYRKQLHEQLRPVLMALSDIGIASAALMFKNENREYAWIVGWSLVPREEADMMNAEMISLVRRYDPKLEVIMPEKVQ